MTRYSLPRCLARTLITTRILATATTVMGLVLAASGDVGAQQRPIASDSAEEGNENGPAMTCSAAARILEKGHPAKRVALANQFIVRCNAEAPAAFASNMRRLRTSTDTAALNRVLTGALYVQDADFFTAAYEVATDPAASAQARAAGLLVAAMELTDLTEFGYHELVTTPDLWICPLMHSDHSLRMAAGAPLPSGAAARLRAAAAAVPKTAPNMVVMAARCAGIVATRVSSQ